MRFVCTLSLMIVVLGAAARLEAATATWDRNPEATVTGYRLSYGTQSGSHPTSIAVGNVITYQFFPPAGQRYYVVVQAYDNAGGLSAKSTEVIFDMAGANLPPVLTLPANQTSVQNTAVSLALIASDPNGTALTFSAVGLPPGLSVSASTGVIAGTVTTTGTYSVTATASDGSLTASRPFSWIVSPVNRAPVLTQPAAQTNPEGSTLSLALAASDPDGNPLAYSATGLPGGLAINTSTGVISGTPTFTSAGVYSVTATVSDGALSQSRSFSWTIANTNRAPVLTPAANQNGMEGVPAALALVASDPDGTALTFSATGLPSGLSINASSGLISGTPGIGSAGSFTVVAMVSDGSLSRSTTFSWTISVSSGLVTVTLSPADTTLNIDSTNVSTDQRLNTYTYPANRVANVILMKFDLSQVPANATVQSAVLQLALVAVDGATTDPTYSVSLHQVFNRNPDITRATGMTADGIAPWTPNACCLDGVPLAQADLSPARSVAAVNRTLGFKTWDARTLVQSWISAPAANFGLALNSDVTKPADRYRFFASMENPTVANRPSLRITYTIPGGTDTTAPAVAMTAPANNATVLGAAVPVSTTATDAVGVVGVQFKLDGVNLGNEDTTSPYSISWNTTLVTSGSHVLTAVARDASGNSATSSAITVTVSNPLPNRAPTMTQPANQTTAEGGTASLALVASDPDGNPLTFGATGLPGGLAINASTGVISGTPTFTSAGAFTVTATVSDGALSQSRTFTWTITNTNRAPALTQPANQTGAEGISASLALAATDADGSALTFSATGLPGGLAINASSGLISGTPSFTSAGTATVTATVSDGALSQSRTFTWTITEANRAPVLTQPANQAGAEGEPVTLGLVASDPDGNTLTYSATGLPGGLVLSPSTGVFSGTPTFTSAGAFTVTAMVSDGSLTHSRTFTWTITNTNRAPVFTQPANQIGAAGSSAILALSAVDPDGQGLTYQATGLPLGLTINATTGVISGVLVASSGGVYTVSVTASDGALVSSVTFTWSIDNADTPLQGDFDGDTRADPATYRASTGEWRVWMSINNFVASSPIVWGGGSDIPVPADYDGDHRTDIAVYRPAIGTWHVLLSTTNMQSSLDVQWGNANDRPVPIDYDGDGKADLALPRFGGFEILLSSTNYTTSVTVR